MGGLVKRDGYLQFGDTHQRSKFRPIIFNLERIIQISMIYVYGSMSTGDRYVFQFNVTFWYSSLKI